MKTNLLKTALALMISLLLHGAATAQTLVTPTLTDNLWASPGSAIGCGINTAMIDYPIESHNFSWGRLAACAYGGGGEGVQVTDINSPFYTVNVSYPIPIGSGGSGYDITNCPDVILGNNINSLTPDQDFIMAVLFVNNDPGFTGGATVEIDYFDIHYAAPGGGSFTVTFNSYQEITIPYSGYPLGVTHLDVVADYAHNISPLYAGLPVCDKFFITFDAYTSYTYNVFAAYGSLGAYNVATTSPNMIDVSRITTFTSDNVMPDVAGVQQAISGGSPHDVARLVYTDGSYPGGILLYLEWDVTAGTVNPGSYPATVDGTTSAYYSNPRIDANDNYATNTNTLVPTPPAWPFKQCSAQIACEYLDPSGNNDVKAYNPVASGTAGSNLVSSWIDEYNLLPVSFYPHPLPIPGGATYNHYRPAVAYAPNPSNGDEYMITECTNIPSVSGDFFMMSPMQPCVASGLAKPPLSSTYRYFETCTSYSATSSNYANSVSTPCNNPSDMSLAAFTNGGSIYYKTNIYNPSGNGYAYKKGNTTAALGPTPDSHREEEMVSVYPNPASDHITVNNPADMDATRYCIKNVLGQIIASGSMTTGRQDINIVCFPAGNYIFSTYKDGAPVGNILFVKK